jgi:glucokinase
MAQYLGFDVGGTKTAVLTGTGSGEILGRIEWETDATRGPQPLIAEMLENARKLEARHGASTGAGVSIGGPMDAARGVIHSPPNLPGWDAIPLKALLEDALAIAVNVEHDAAACALAESLWGAGKEKSRVVYLTCATGFGMGIVIDGKPYYGAGGASPEIGHYRYAQEGPEAYGKRGTFEAFCSGRSLSRLAAWKFPSRWGAEPPEPSEISNLASQGDADARAIIALNAEAVGDACALIGDVFVPEVIVLGSLSRYLGSTWIDAVKARFLEEVLPAAGGVCEICAPLLGERLQDCSAIAAAVRAG